MNTWIRTTMAIIAAGSMGLSLTACGSKDKTDEALANRPTAITAELLNGPWVFTESSETSIKEINELRIWVIKDTKAGFLDNHKNSPVKCDDIKDAFARMKDDQFWKMPSDPGYDPQYHDGHTYDFNEEAEFSDTYTTFTISNDVYGVRLDGGTLTFSLIKSARSEPVDHFVFMRPDQGDAKAAMTAICDEVPAWK